MVVTSGGTNAWITCHYSVIWKKAYKIDIFTVDGAQGLFLPLSSDSMLFQRCQKGS